VILPALHRWFVITMLSGLLMPFSQAATAPAPQSLVETFENYQPASGSIAVQIGLQVDEITAINQQAESFSVVGTLQMQWQQPDLAFEPESGEEAFRIFEDEDFVAYAREHNARLPRFTFFNQQGRRYTQNKLVVLLADGQANYFERFTVTLQAPYFHFSKFPFDAQDFYIDIDLFAPVTAYRFIELRDYSGLGEMLGLEEWDVSRFDTAILEKQQLVGYNSSSFRFHLHAERKTQYYKLRIFAPIAIIILISWVTFFLRDYRKRIDIAGSNLLIFIAFNFIVSGDLPRLSYLTYMDSILFTAFFITGLTIIVNVMLRYLEVNDRLALARRIDYFIIWGYPVLYILGFAFAYQMFL
jgi:hypothetical protein